MLLDLLLLVVAETVILLTLKLGFKIRVVLVDNMTDVVGHTLGSHLLILRSFLWHRLCRLDLRLADCGDTLLLLRLNIIRGDIASLFTYSLLLHLLRRANPVGNHLLRDLAHNHILRLDVLLDLLLASTMTLTTWLHTLNLAVKGGRC